MIQLKCRNLLYCILLFVFNTHTFVHQRKFTRPYLLPDFITILDRLSLVKFEQFHPLKQQLLVLEEKLLLFIVLIPVAHFNTKTSLSLKNPFDS